MSRTVFYDVPRGVLATLLDWLGRPEALSPRPLMGPVTAINRQQLAELYAGGFLELPGDGSYDPTPAFARAAQVILAPNTTVNLRAWRDESSCAETCLLFPENILEEDGVVLNQVDGSYRISWPVGRDDLVGLLGGLIPPVTGEAHAFDFEAHLDGPVAATLCGLIDLLNEAETTGRHGIPADQLGAYLNGRWGLTGFNSLVSYVTVIGSMPSPPALNMVEFSLSVLERAGLVEEKSGCYTISSALEPLLKSMPSVMPGIQWQRISDSDGNELLVSHRIYVFGNRGLILRFAPSSRGRIFINSVTTGELLDELVDELVTLIPRVKRDKPSSQQGETAGSRVCASCGKRHDQPRKFCTACGAPMNATSDAVPAVSQRCRVCNAPLVPGNKFCTHCGAPV